MTLKLAPEFLKCESQFSSTMHYYKQKIIVEPVPSLYRNLNPWPHFLLQKSPHPCKWMFFSMAKITVSPLCTGVCTILTVLHIQSSGLYSLHTQTHTLFNMLYTKHMSIMFVLNPSISHLHVRKYPFLALWTITRPWKSIIIIIM